MANKLPPVIQDRTISPGLMKWLGQLREIYNSLDTAVSNNNQSKLTALDSINSDYRYFGIADFGSATSGAVWQLFRIDEGVVPTVQTYADGDALFDNIWDDRESYSYS